jgi:hypothetical protein
MLAVELYRVMRHVEELEKKLRLPASSSEREGLEQELRRARAERDRIKAMLEGAKDNG